MYSGSTLSPLSVQSFTALRRLTMASNEASTDDEVRLEAAQHDTDDATTLQEPADNAINTSDVKPSLGADLPVSDYHRARCTLAGLAHSDLDCLRVQSSQDALNTLHHACCWELLALVPPCARASKLCSNVVQMVNSRPGRHRWCPEGIEPGDRQGHCGESKAPLHTCTSLPVLTLFPAGSEALIVDSSVTCPQSTALSNWRNAVM